MFFNQHILSSINVCRHTSFVESKEAEMVKNTIEAAVSSAEKEAAQTLILSAIKIAKKDDKKNAKRWNKKIPSSKLVVRGKARVNARIISIAAERLRNQAEIAYIKAKSIIESITDYRCELALKNNIYYCKYDRSMYCIGNKYKISVTAEELLEILDKDYPEVKMKKELKKIGERIANLMGKTLKTHDYRFRYLNANGIQMKILDYGKNPSLEIKFVNNGFASKVILGYKLCQNLVQNWDYSYRTLLGKLEDNYLREAGKYYLNGCKPNKRDDDNNYLNINYVMKNKK